MTVEEREHGLSSIATWLLWFKHAGGIPFIVLHVVFMAFDRFIYVAVEWWLARWTAGAYEGIEVFGIPFAPQVNGRSAQADYILVYALLIALSVLGTFVRSEWVGKLVSTITLNGILSLHTLLSPSRAILVTGGSRAARRVFQAMLSRVLRAPMSYFGK